VRETATFDAVVCVGPHKVQTANLAVRSLQLFARPRCIYLIASAKYFPKLQSLSRPSCPVVLMDEDTFIESVSLQVVGDYLTNRVGTAHGMGWYFQQFLKMAAARLPNVASHYLIWDSDTIMLKPVEFFDAEGRVLVNPKEENHPPYFDLTERLLGYRRTVSFSFISEHFMVNGAHMRELLQLIEARNPKAKNWVYAILDHITTENFKNCGMSEFEMFGNFLQMHHSESYRCRSLCSLREGAAQFGMSPNKCDLYYLAKQGHCFVSFERWNQLRGWRLWASKAKALTRYSIDYSSNIISGKNKTNFQIVASLCNESEPVASWKPSIPRNGLQS
jgi:hypothetical protein